MSHHSVCRWVEQVVTFPGRTAPRLDRVLVARTRALTGTDDSIVLLDGTCIPVHTPIGRAEKQFWCPNHKPTTYASSP